jgi:regulator of cell morphogenesis and NO signaling
MQNQTALLENYMPHIQSMTDSSVITCSGSASVSELVSGRLGLARVFEKHGLEYCCGLGNLGLEEACAVQGASLNEVLTEIAAERDTPSRMRDHAAISPEGTEEIIQHLLTVHHPYLRAETARLERLIDRVANRHGQHHYELWEIQSVFEELKDVLTERMDTEAQMVFPALRLVAIGGVSGPLKASTLAGILPMLERNNAYLVCALEKTREITDNFKAPVTACTMYRVVLDSLSWLDWEIQHYLREEATLHSLTEKTGEGGDSIYTSP